ncbi:MAG: sigma-70 family RNA polymerase sigma factor [Akkermansia sp.]|nr:sigma-70 family RNA polymerase sigma factor [Akkermansia sp.]
MRLGDWKDQKSWDEFYRTYWRLIYSVALKAGLREEEAWDVVQETVLTIAKQSVKGMYDPSRGSFKMWLWHITRWRINDQFRQRRKDTAASVPTADGTQREPLSDIPDTSGETFTKIWDREWQNNVMKAAIERVKMRVSPQQFQIFDYNVLRGMSAGEVRKKLGVSVAQVYLAKHRVGSVLKKEVAYIRSQEEAQRQS